MSADEGEGEDEDRAPNTDVEDAEVADGIAVGKDEEKGDHDVGEGEPVSAVGNEGIGFVGDLESFSYFENPVGDAAVVGGIEISTSSGDEVGEKVQLVEKWKGGHPAENEPDGDNDNGDSNFAKVGHACTLLSVLVRDDEKD